MKYFSLVFLLLCCSCAQYSDEDEFDSIPVTNNPYIVPNHGSSLPMM